MFVPCVSVCSSENWINPLKYSIYGEVGCTVWSFGGPASGNSFCNSIVEMFAERQSSAGDKVGKRKPEASDLIISIIYVNGNGTAVKVFNSTCLFLH